ATGNDISRPVQYGHKEWRYEHPLQLVECSPFLFHPLAQVPLLAKTASYSSGTPLPTVLGKRKAYLPERSFRLIDRLECHGASGQLLGARCNRCQCRGCLLQCRKIGRLSSSIVDGLSSESSSPSV